jgi:hypothetical protein
VPKLVVPAQSVAMMFVTDGLSELLRFDRFHVSCQGILLSHKHASSK